MKRIMILLAAVALTAALAVTAAAEYVACLPGEEHVMSDWKKIAENEDGSVVYERVCSKCGYHQKGFGGFAPSGGVGTTRSVPEHLAVTTSLEAGPGSDTPLTAANPSTGARA